MTHQEKWAALLAYLERRDGVRECQWLHAVPEGLQYWLLAMHEKHSADKMREIYSQSEVAAMENNDA